MKWRTFAPRATVIVYFGCFALLWSGLAAIGTPAGGGADSAHVASGMRTGLFGGMGIVALACHAAAVVLLAWKAHRWLFSHGPIAVAFCGLPLVPLVANAWFVPVFLYLIAVLYVWLASRHESVGRVQRTLR